MKSLQTYLMPIFPDSAGFVNDWYDLLGCYFAVEKGLYRANKKCSGVLDFVFPRLHNVWDSIIAKNITKIIQDNLPPNLPPKLKSYYTSKLV